MANSISIEIELDESGAIKGFQEVEKKAKKSGKKAGDSFERGLGDSLGRITGKIAKLGTLFGTVLSGATVVKAINAANEQADAIERLNKSLEANNEFSQQASQDLQNYAAELQKVTEFGDELIINNLALAKSFGATNEQAKQITETATGLAKEFNISLESATRNVAKTLGGYAGELGEVIPELKNFTQEQLRSGEAIAMLNARFGDSAKNLPTFSFATKQLSNVFGDLLEEVGKLVTQSPEIRAGIVALTGVFEKAIGKVKAFASSFSFIEDLLIPLSKFGDQIITFIISPLELLGNIFNVAQNALNVFVAAFVAGFGKLAGVAAEFIQFFNPDSETAQALLTFKESSMEVFDEVAASAEESLGKVLEFPVSEKLMERNEELRAGLQETKAIIDENAAAISESLANTVDETSTKNKEKVLSDMELIANATGEAFKSMQMSMKQLGGTLANLAVRGYGQAAKAIGSALAKGEDASQAFADVAKETAAKAADAIADYYILNGVGRIASSYGTDATGYQMLAAGTALKMFAGAVGGTGADATATGGGGAGVGAGAGGGLEETQAAVATAEPQQEEQVVNQVVVQGDVLDSEETGLRIFEIISEQSEKNGNVIVGGAFA